MVGMPCMPMKGRLLTEWILRQVTKVPAAQAGLARVGSNQTEQHGKGCQHKAHVPVAAKPQVPQTHAQLMMQIQQTEEPVSVGGGLRE